MAKQEGITVEGKIVKALPSTNFDIELDNGHMVKAHLCGKMRKNHIRIVPDDRVHVSLSPYDLNRGIITYRIK